jgi:hypothetical protein
MQAAKIGLQKYIFCSRVRGCVTTFYNFNENYQQINALYFRLSRRAMLIKYYLMAWLLLKLVDGRLFYFVQKDCHVFLVEALVQREGTTHKPLRPQYLPMSH